MIPRRQVIEWAKLEASHPPRCTLCLLLDVQSHYWIGFWDGSEFAIQSDVANRPELVEWAELVAPEDDREFNDALVAILDGAAGPAPGSDTIVSAVSSCGLRESVVRELDRMVVWAHAENETFETMCRARKLKAGSKKRRVARLLWNMRYGGE